MVSGDRYAWWDSLERVSAMNLGATELLIILAVVLLLFGSTRLPKLATSLGQASKEFKKGVDRRGRRHQRDQERLSRRPPEVGFEPSGTERPRPVVLVHG